MSYLTEHGDPVTLVPKQDTEPSAEDAVKQQEPGAEFQPPIPRTIQLVMDSLNDVREELSQLEASYWGNPAETIRTAGSAYRREEYDPERIRMQRRIDELQEMEYQLRAELRKLEDIIPMVGEKDAAFNAEVTVIGADA